MGNDPWGSDHFPISIIINLTPELPKVKNTRHKLYTNRTNWESFQRSMDNDLKNLSKDYANLDAPILYTNFTCIIEKALTVATPNIPKHQSSNKTKKDN